MATTLFAGTLAFLNKPETDKVLNVIFAKAADLLALPPTTAENCILSNGAEILSIEVSLKNDDRLVSKVVFVYEPPEDDKDWRLNGGFINSDGYLALSSNVVEPTPENGLTKAVIRTTCGLDYRVLLTVGLHEIIIS